MADETPDLQQARAKKRHKRAIDLYLDSRRAAAMATRTWADMHLIDHRHDDKDTSPWVVRLWSLDSHAPHGDLAYLDAYDGALAYATAYNWTRAQGARRPPSTAPFTTVDDDLADLAD